MKERESLILAALLHDIGKFIQRAQIELTPEYARLKTDCCPGGYSHIHVLYSGWFIKQFLGKEFEKTENLVLYHHLTENFPDDRNRRLVKIIKLADWLSSSERQKKEDIENVNYKKQPLINIFSEVKKSLSNSSKQFSPLLKLPSHNVDFRFIDQLSPRDDKTEIVNEDVYKKLWDECAEDAGHLRGETSFDFLFERILYLLEKYTIFIPSSTMDKPVISLYHHVKSTAAIAVCLYDSAVEEKEIDEILDYFKNNNIFPEKEKRFLVVEGDISGIQNFIYSLTSEGALKGLKGRSVYVQLLSEAIANNILKKMRLPRSNLIFVGGGNFQIIIPNIAQAKEKIEDIIKKTDEILYSAHNGKICCVIGQRQFSYNHFSSENFAGLISALKTSLAREKRRKFKYKVGSDFFKTEPVGIGECPICGEDIKYVGNDEKCAMCKSFELLSSKIRNCKVIKIVNISSQDSLSHNYNTLEDVLESFGYRYEFLKEIQRDSKCHSYLVNSSDFLQEGFTGFRFENTYLPALEEGISVTLDVVASDAQIKKLEEGKDIYIGMKRWGVLRMDVDNLGMIFSKWLVNPTISKYSQLSYNLSLFFKFCVEKIIEQQEYSKCIVVYSGGDDLSIIGPWSELPSLAIEINNKFQMYVGNPNITISGGIYITPSVKYPVYHASLEAGKFEKKAKEEGKNRINFLERTLTWTEIEKIRQVKDELFNLLEPEDCKEKVPRSLLGMIASIYAEKERNGEMHIPKIWRLYYAIKRLAVRHKKGDVEQMQFAQKLIDMFVTDYDLHANLDAAVQWTDYLTRREKQ